MRTILNGIIAIVAIIIAIPMYIGYLWYKYDCKLMGRIPVDVTAIFK